MAYVGVTKQYRRLDYVESTGTQFIGTGIIPDSNTRAVMDFQYTDVTSASRSGCVATAPNNFFFGYGGDGYLFMCCASTSDATITLTLSADTNRHTFDISNAALKYDDVSYGTGTLVSCSPYEMYILGCNVRWNPPATYLAKQKIYSCQIYSGDTLVRDFVPVLDDNNVACLLDMVESKLYYSNAAEPLVAGNILPDTYATITNKAMKIYQANVGVNGTAKKIIKGYVGVNGVAKLIFEPAKRFSIKRYASPEYYRNLGVCNTEDYIVTAGGFNPSNVMATYSEWYDASGIKTTGSALTYKRHMTANVFFEGKALFVGGATTASGTWTGTQYCEAYDNSKVLTTLGDATYPSYGAKAGCNSSYALICGSEYGTSGLKNPCLYSTSFVASSGAAMTTGRYNHAVGRVGENILIVGGWYASTLNGVDYYDTNATKSTLSNLPGGRAGMMRANLKNHVVFAGGSSANANNTPLKDVYSYDLNLVRTTLTDLDDAGMNGTGTDCDGEYTLFVTYNFPKFVTVYDDKTLTRQPYLRPFATRNYAWSGRSMVAASTKKMAAFEDGESNTGFSIIFWR